MKKPRLTDADRLEIEHGLREGKTMYAVRPYGRYGLRQPIGQTKIPSSLR